MGVIVGHGYESGTGMDASTLLLMLLILITRNNAAQACISSKVIDGLQLLATLTEVNGRCQYSWKRVLHHMDHKRHAPYKDIYFCR